MGNTGKFTIKSLKDQVYEYLRLQIQTGKLQPGSEIDFEKNCKELGISRTPLRDALIQLEAEGFVTIIPRRGAYVKALTLGEIKEIFEVIGAMESAALLMAAPKLKAKDYEALDRLNREMKTALAKDNFDLYHRKNLRFHDIFLNLCGNALLRNTVNVYKKRIHDFPQPKEYILEWEESLIKEHERMAELIKKHRFEEAAEFLRNVHWSFEVQEKYAREFYKQMIAQDDAENE